MLTTLQRRPARPGHRPAGRRCSTREVTVDADHLADYAHLCGFTLRDELPPTYPHVLGFPLHMALLAKAPFSAIGVVHIANRIIQYAPAAARRAADAHRLGARLRAAPPRTTFDFVTEARVRDELVWQGFATNLKRGDGDESVPKRAAPSRRRPSPPNGASPTTSAAATRRSPATTTRSTCTRSRPRRSASRARSRTACGPRPAPSPRCACPDAFAVDVRFKQPILLPSKVSFGEQEDRFAVHGHLEGEFTPIA